MWLPLFLVDSRFVSSSRSKRIFQGVGQSHSRCFRVCWALGQVLFIPIVPNLRQGVVAQCLPYV